MNLVFGRGEEGEEVFFELEPDEFFGANVFVVFGVRWVGVIPCVVYRLRQEVDPASVCCGEGEGGSEGGGGYVDCAFVELEG